MVPKQVWESLPPDPEIEALKQCREMLKAGRYRYKGQGNEEEIRVLSGALERNKRNAPTWDIERQVAGEEELEELEEAWQLEIDRQIPERAELAKAFLFQPELPTFEDILELCIHAVDVMFRLC
ncbi:FluG domain-containing protein [Apiospora phragmitis]|uniref:FluG domain-containing protein n=1 Tax=Apiospora phragmitis TaxID=2905665 RepID=A0ABR1VRY9_9PEZI